MSEINYYDESITNDMEVLRTQIAAARDLTGPEKENAIKDMIKFKNSIRNRLLQFKSEVKNCKDPVQKGVFEKRLTDLEAKHKDYSTQIDDIKKPKAKVVIEDTKPKDMGDVSGLTAPAQVLERGVDIQADALRSIARSQRLIQNADDTAVATMHELARQKDTINEIDKEVDLLESNVKRAGREVRWFARNLATDKFFMCIFVCVVLVLLGIIGWKIYKGTSSSGGSSPSPPASGAPPVSIIPMFTTQVTPSPITPTPPPPTNAPAPPATTTTTPPITTTSPPSTTLVPPSVTGSASVFVSGILIDQYCYDNGTDFDGNNVTQFPEKHRAGCAVMDVCIPYGYMIITPEVDYYLDEVSNALAVAYLRSLPANRTNLIVNVTGILNATTSNLTIVGKIVDGVDAVVSSSPTPTPTTSQSSNSTNNSTSSQSPTPTATNATTTDTPTPTPTSTNVTGTNATTPTPTPTPSNSNSTSNSTNSTSGKR
eukprot:PhF_6_TR15677/c1_g1_i2/m.24377